MAATVADGASVVAVPVSGSHSQPPVGEGKGAVGDERDAGTKGVEALGDSEEDGEDVFEVERILDMKTEGVREPAGPGAAEGKSREVVRVAWPEASGGAGCEGR